MSENSLKGILVCVVILFLVEAVARVAHTVYHDLKDATVQDGPAMLAYSPRLGWTIKHPFEGRPFKGQWQTTGYRSYNAQGILTVDAPELGHAGKQKILFIGASDTFGYGVKTTQSFPEVVDDLLPTADTINLGVIGYSSYQSRLVAMAQVPALRPDVIVVDSGFNDRREAYHEAADGPETFKAFYQSLHSPVAGITIFLQVSYTYRALEKLFRAVGLIPEDHKFVSLATAKPRVSEKSFRDNLVAIAEVAKAAGASVVYLLTPDSPTANIYRAEGVRRLEAGNYRSAAAVLEVAINEVANNDERNYRPLARLYLADAYRALGETDKADKVLMHEEFPNSDGGMPIRPAQTYNAITRDVAALYGATIVDLEDVIKRRPYLISKTGHLTVEGHRVVAEELVKVLRPMIAKGSQNARK